MYELSQRLLISSALIGQINLKSEKTRCWPLLAEPDLDPGLIASEWIGAIAISSHLALSVPVVLTAWSVLVGRQA